MKDLAKMFSFFGQYKTLIQDLIDHLDMEMATVSIARN